ncbi:symplekin-like [Tubulanus polymorphus]|uniref:symplekin-like n=1 Tax=Tubulanus polymorphus TaxID=672921 RepID=UPI003DA419A8
MAASDSRRCPASQFFMDEDAPEGGTADNTYHRVVDLLNKAGLQQRDAAKITNLKQVQELIINKDLNLLDNFLDEMMAFQMDKSPEVRKFVVGFMDEASKKEPELLPKFIGYLHMMMNDENVNVIKKIILSMTRIYRSSLQWLLKSKEITEQIESMWKYVNVIKETILKMIDSENDGIRTHAVKFVENLVLTLTERSSESEIPKNMEHELTLDKIPQDHQFIKYKKLEDEGAEAFKLLIEFQCSAHISSVNLMAVMSSMTCIARQRPEYLPRVIQGFESLHANLPPTLAKSQVSSVRKNLKMQLLLLLKHPMSFSFHAQITTLLTDLGASTSEVLKFMPKMDERKRKALEEAAAPKLAPKKLKKDAPVPISTILDDIEISTPLVTMRNNSSSSSGSKPRKPTTVTQQQSNVDITAGYIEPKLTPENVADLVLVSMVMLPDTMPDQFQSTYTPIAAAGTDAQIKHLSRLLATQLVTAGLGKGDLQEDSAAKDKDKKSKKDGPEPMDEDDNSASSKQTIHTIVGGHVDAAPGYPGIEPMKPPSAAITASLTSSRRGIKHFKLTSVTKQMTPEDTADQALSAFNRILNAEKSAKMGNASVQRMKLLTNIVCIYGSAFKQLFQEYIFENLAARSELAFIWLYQEYSNAQGYLLAAAEKQNMSSYDECLTQLLSALLERPDQRSGLFARLILEAPLITPAAIDVLKKYCQDETRIYLGMSILRDLILKRPNQKLNFLVLLLEFCANEKPDVRSNALRVTKSLYERTDLKEYIENYAMRNLRKLLLPFMPGDLFTKTENLDVDGWTEESIKTCLYLYLGLMPVRHKLIHELSNIYVTTSANVKRTILRVLETPVKGMGMQSPELLLLVENCPKGAETLVTRVIHILTDRQAPSPELVDRVRDLYHKRVADVRFLIPVLNGLTKSEVTAALPKLIMLNPNVVKEVFNKLLGGHAESGGFSGPLTPAELLSALHTIDPTKVDMKTIIKACNLCFSERKIYTQEVLAVVMQQLMEMNPLPVLLMRTVIQSLSSYPRLIGFVLNILQRLITKQVWKNKKVWEGFIKCCQRTKPQSFQVLLQLPSVQLNSVFEVAPEMRDPLLKHVHSLAPNQRAHIPPGVMSVLETKNVLPQPPGTEPNSEEIKAAHVPLKTITTITNVPTTPPAPGNKSTPKTPTTPGALVMEISMTPKIEEKKLKEKEPSDTPQPEIKDEPVIPQADPKKEDETEMMDTSESVSQVAVNLESSQTDDLIPDRTQSDVNLDSSQSKVVNLDSSQSEVVNLDSSQSEVVNLDSSQSEVVNLDGSQSEVVNLDSSQSEALNLDSSQSEVVNLDSSQSEVENLDSSQTEANLESSQLEVMNLDNSQTDIVNLDSSQSEVEASEKSLALSSQEEPPSAAEDGEIVDEATPVKSEAVVEKVVPTQRPRRGRKPKAETTKTDPAPVTRRSTRTKK